MGFIDGGAEDKSGKVRGTIHGEQMKLSKENENFRENYLRQERMKRADEYFYSIAVLINYHVFILKG